MLNFIYCTGSEPWRHSRSHTPPAPPKTPGRWILAAVVRRSYWSPSRLLSKHICVSVDETLFYCSHPSIKIYGGQEAKTEQLRSHYALFTQKWGASAAVATHNAALLAALFWRTLKFWDRWDLVLCHFPRALSHQNLVVAPRLSLLIGPVIFWGAKKTI